MMQRSTNPSNPSKDVENRMIVEINGIISRYMSRPDWSSPYRCTFEWTVEGERLPPYTILLVITEPTNRP